MIQVQKIADAVRAHFQAKAQHTVNIAAGPKREAWFSAEMFVAISELSAWRTSSSQVKHRGPTRGSKARRPNVIQAKLPFVRFRGVLNFAVYGEQALVTLDERLTSQKRPDLVLFDPSSTQGSPKDPAVSTVIEVKLFRTDENNLKELESLKTQLDGAADALNSATIAGVVFVVTARMLTPGQHPRAVKRIRSDMEQMLPDADYEWVDGHDLSELIPPMYTSFGYPRNMVALTMGVRVRRAQMTSPAP